MLLTSHYMADVQALCRRVVLIGDGSLVFDGTLDVLSAQVAPFKVVSVTTQTPPPAWPQLPSWGMIVQLAWLTAAGTMAYVLWRLGVRRHAAVGG